MNLEKEIRTTKFGSFCGRIVKPPFNEKWVKLSKIVPNIWNLNKESDPARQCKNAKTDSIFKTKYFSKVPEKMTYHLLYAHFEQNYILRK